MYLLKIKHSKYYKKKLDVCRPSKRRRCIPNNIINNNLLLLLIIMQ